MLYWIVILGFAAATILLSVLRARGILQRKQPGKRRVVVVFACSLAASVAGLVLAMILPVEFAWAPLALVLLGPFLLNAL